MKEKKFDYAAFVNDVNKAMRLFSKACTDYINSDSHKKTIEAFRKLGAMSNSGRTDATDFKQKFIDLAHSKFGIKPNGSINFEQAFEVLDEIDQREQFICPNEELEDKKRCEELCEGCKHNFS